MGKWALLVFATLAVISCDDDGTGVEDSCMATALPLSGAADGPTVTDVGLEIQPGTGAVVVATATDPQGSENLAGVLQTVGVFADPGCNGVVIELEDDLAGSGVEETFGTAAATEDVALFQAISAASSWPVEVTFADLDGNTTEGRVMARVIP